MGQAAPGERQGTEGNHRAVVDGVVGGGARHHQPIQQADRDARILRHGTFQHAAGGGAVPEYAVAVAPLQRGGNIRAAIEHVAHMAERHGVENGMDGFSIVRGELVIALYLGARAGRAGHGGALAVFCE